MMSSKKLATRPRGIDELFDFASVEVCVGAAHGYVKHMRCELDKNERRRVRRNIFQDEGVLAQDRKKYSQYEIHHIVPLSFGGCNEYGNFALVDKDLHSTIHYFLDVQSKPFPGKPRAVCIPRLPGKIWQMRMVFGYERVSL